MNHCISCGADFEAKRKMCSDCIYYRLKDYQFAEHVFGCDHCLDTIEALILHSSD